MLFLLFTRWANFEACSGQIKTLSISRQRNLDIYKQKNYLVNDLTKDLDWTGAHRWQADGALEALEDFLSFPDKKHPPFHLGPNYIQVLVNAFDKCPKRVF